MSYEFVGIQLDLIGAEAVERDLKEIDKLLNSFGGRKKVKSGMADLAKDIAKARGELEKYQRLRESYLKAGGEGNAFVGEIDEAKKHLKDLQQAQREVQASTKNLGRTFGQEFNSISSKVAHVGSAMQSLGNALTRLTSPFNRLTTGLLMGAGYKALNTLTEGLSNSFGRADTMKKYERLMKEYETANYSATQSRQDLDDSIQGLPIALDDAIGLAQRYTLSLGDMERGTQLAIATNNAFLASMATEQQRYQGMLQMQDLMNGKDLNSREWMSLGASMGKAINEVGLQLGYSKDQLGEFRQELYAGNIATQDFLDALIKVGTGSGSLVQLAKVSAETWEGLFSNIRIAVTRMGANVIDTLNETFKDATGRTLLQQLLGKDAEGNELGDGVKHWIDGISKSVQNWIRSNPDKILDFFNALKAIDWKGLLKGIAEGMGMFLKVIEAFAGLAGKVDMETIGKWLPRLNLLGKGLTIFGGVLKGTRHIWALLGVGGKYLGKGIIGKLGKIGIFAKLASLFGKKKELETVAETAGKVPTVATTVRSAFKSLEGLMKVAGAVTIAGFTGFVAFRSVKTMIHDLKGIISELRGMDETDLKVGAGVIGGMTTFFGAMAGLGKVVGKVPAETSLGILKGEAIIGAVVTLASVIADANMWLIQNTFKNFSKAISYFQEGIDTLNNIPSLTGADGVKQKISDAITAFNEISELLNGRYVDKGVKEGGFEGISKRKSNAMGYLSTAIRHIQTIAQDLNNLAALEVNANVKTKIDSIKTAVNDIENALPNMLNKISGPKNLSANTEAFANALIGIRRMAYHINRLAGTDVNTGGFASFVAQLKTALESLKDVQGDLELDIRVKIATGFQTSVNNVIKSINNAKKKITTAAGKGIRVTIPVSIRFSVTSNIGTALGMIAGWRNNLRNQGGGGGSRHTGVQEAMGGYIYRANGGGVPFRRRGTDTVPAMLTPGEYVQNRRAVSAFGIDFMRKVNNLDMKGAMNELMHRAGGMANINRGTSIVNNNYNNQKVTINNNGNTGAGFTFKSASRFVGAF